MHGDRSRDLLGEGWHGIADGERRPEGALAIAAMGARGFEHRHDAVAYVFVDMPTMLGYDGVGVIEVPAK
jgi:hypothetical protein